MDEPDLVFEPMHEREPQRALHDKSLQQVQRREGLRKLQVVTNRFFLPPGQEVFGDRPGRLMAAIEVPDVNEEGAPLEPGYAEPTYLECVEANWYANRVLDSDSWLDVYREAPLSVLELTSRPRPELSPDDQPGDIAWFSYSYAPSNGLEADANLYNSLLGVGVPVRITEAERVSAPASGPMCKTGWLPASAGAIYSEMRPGMFAELVNKVLHNSLASTAGVAIYDVGQGACQAIVSMERHLPLVYVDFGGGVFYNRATFPKDTTGFCFTRRPPIVLSHWDWDHWSAVARFPEALNSDWLTPPVPGTPIQQSLAAALYRLGRLHVWPSGACGEVKLPGIRIERCKGNTSNDSGFAVTAYSGRTGKRNCLLPGDASYRYVPSVVAGERFSALCMTHHGGRLHSAHYPAAKSRAVAVNSAGPRNSYKHPLLSTVSAHLGAGWPVPATTGFSNQRPCHVLLPWGKQPYLFRGGCHAADGRCSVVPAQTAPHATAMKLGNLAVASKKAKSKSSAFAGLVLP